MNTRTALTAVSDGLFRRLFKLLFRYDIFISYARRDGKEYALKLSEQLTRLDFSCFLDYDELPAGNSLNRSLGRAIRKSAVLVLVGTEGALKSRYVELEVGAFAATQRAIIPIDFEGTLADSPWGVIRERDLVWVDETKEALARGVPSPPVADAVDKLFKYTRRNVRVRGQVIAAAALFVLGAAVSIFFIRQSVRAAETQKLAAVAATRRAQEEEKKARASAEEARLQADLARRMEKEASEKAEEAERNADEARKQGELARKQGEIARKQTAVAEKQAQLARVKAEEAEQRQRLATSRELAADSAAQLSSDTQASLAQAVRAFETSPTAEAEKALRQALLEPRVRGVIEGFRERAAGTPFSPDGELIVTVTKSAGDGNDRAKVSQVSTGRVLAEAEVPGGSSVAASFSPDGKTVLLADDNAFRLWRWETRAAPAVVTAAGTGGAAFTPDGRRVLTVTNQGVGVVQLWDLNESGAEPVKTFYGSHVNKGGRGAHYVPPFFSPDGRFVVAQTDAEGGEQKAAPSRVWDVSAGRWLPALQDSLYVSEAIFSPDGQLMLGLSQKSNRMGTARLWDLETGRHFGGAEEAVGRADFLAFSPDSKQFLTAGGDGFALKLWEVPGGREGEAVKLVWALAGHLARVTGAAFSPDGRFVLSGSQDTTARLWDVNTGRPASVLRGHKGAVRRVAFGGGEVMLTVGADKAARVWAPSMGQGLGAGAGLPRASDARFDTENNLFHGAPVLRAGEKIYSPDGRYALAVKDGHTLEVSEAAGGRPLASRRLKTKAVHAAAFSPDGRLVAAGGDDRTAQVWDWGGDKLLAPLIPGRYVLQVVFSPAGRHVATVADGDGHARIWEWPQPAAGPRVSPLGKYRKLGALELIYEARDLAFSPDGRLLVTASWRDHALTDTDTAARVWDAETGEPALPPLQGHFAPVVAVAYSRDGRFILTGSEDGSARLWEAATGRAVADLFGSERRVRHVAFGGDGKSIVVVSGEGAGKTRLYDCAVCGPVEELLAGAKGRAAWRLTGAVSEARLR